MVSLQIKVACIKHTILLRHVLDSLIWFISFSSNRAIALHFYHSYITTSVDNWMPSYENNVINLQITGNRFSVLKHKHTLHSYTPPGVAFEGGKWGDCLRPCSWGGPALQAYEFVKLYSPVNWKCWYMLRLKKSFFFKVKFRSVVLGCLLYRNRLRVAPKGTPVARP